jgi:hydroxypyruvate reductase
VNAFWKNGCEVTDFLSENNSNEALRISDDLLQIGATGTNVADVQILIIS